MARRRDKREELALAHTRMHSLLAAAEQEALAGRTGLADRYAFLVRRLAMRHQAGLPTAARTKVCRGCDGFLGPRTARTRMRHGKVVTTCLRCQRIRRRPVEAR